MKTPMEIKVIVNGQGSINGALQQVTSILCNKSYLSATGENQPYEIIIQPLIGRTRTPTQNNAMHLWLDMLAMQLNAQGMDMRYVMKETAELPWTQATAKDNLWKPVQKAVTGEDSTTRPNTKQYNEIYTLICKHLSEKFGFQSPEWPSMGGPS